MNYPPLLIFDMDGVIIDSEPIYKKTFLEMIDDYGLDSNEFDYNSIVGMNDHDIWSFVKCKYLIKMDVDSLIDNWKKRKWESLHSNEIFIMDGVLDILKWSKKNKMINTIATSSSRAILSHVIKEFNLEDLVEYSVSGDEVIHSKPNPEIFLKVSEKFEISPKNSVVIEDSKNGIIAANKAEMISIGFNNGNSNFQNLNSANYIFSSFRDDFINVIKQIK